MSNYAFVYIMANKRNGTLYTGVTNDLVSRVLEHKARINPESFTAKYNIGLLVWYCSGQDINAAIALEKKIKNRSRSWKIALIEKENPTWRDLTEDLIDFRPCDWRAG